MKTQHRADRRPFMIDSAHPVLGDLSEPSPSIVAAMARARLHEAEGADVVILSPGGNPVYTTDDGVL